MIETVVSMELPVDEKLQIRKQHIEPADFEGSEKRISIVTGIHGDELEGQFVCYELVRRIQEHPEYLHGIVDIYPALNPLGIDSITRGMPMYDLDMNRVFPGDEEGSMLESVAEQIIDELVGSDYCVDIHASNIFLTEMPQVRINENVAERLVPLAKELNMDLLWIHASATVLESTLAYAMNSRNVPTLIVEMGVGMRIQEEYGNQLVEGILNLMKTEGIWSGPVEKVRTPMVSYDREVGFVNAESSGIYLPCRTIGARVKQGEILGNIVDPLDGKIQEVVCAPIDGILFTRREYPVVYSGSLLGRVMGGN